MRQEATPNSHNPSERTAADRRSSERTSRAGLLAFSIVVITLAAIAGLIAGKFVGQDETRAQLSLGGYEEQEPDISPTDPANLNKWKNPSLVVVLSGETHGYLLPCGCSEPQYGGLERRYNFIQSLKARGWPVMAVDLGDISQSNDEVPRKLENLQGALKYETAMKVLHRMDYSAVGLGLHEGKLQSGNNQGLKIPLWEIVMNQKEKLPRLLAANLKDRGEYEKWLDTVGSWEMCKPPGSRFVVGVTGVTGPTIRKDSSWGKDVRWEENNGLIIKQALEEQEKAGVNMRILLYQGYEGHRPDDINKEVLEVSTLVKAFPQFHVVLHLSSSDEPPEKPKRIDNTLVVQVGHKGKYVGVIGVFQNGRDNFEMRYQLVKMEPSLKTKPEDEAKHPIFALLNEYTDTLAKNQEKYLLGYKQSPHPMQVQLKMKDDLDYFGSETCKRCHNAAYTVWAGTPHAHAYKTLVDAKNPTHRQYDAECVVCHVTGFGVKNGFTNEKNPSFATLKDVGCEACHGPASAHLNDPDDKTIHAAMNPWKQIENAELRKRSVSKFCQTCHDQENDVHFTFDKRWLKVDHPTPKKEVGVPKGSGSETLPEGTPKLETPTKGSSTPGLQPTVTPRPEIKGSGSPPALEVPGKGSGSVPPLDLNPVKGSGSVPPLDLNPVKGSGSEPPKLDIPALEPPPSKGSGSGSVSPPKFDLPPLPGTESKGSQTPSPQLAPPGEKKPEK